MNDNLRQFWELESIGIRHDDPKISEKDQAQEIFDKTVQFVNDHYDVQLLWKRVWNELKDNFTVAKQHSERLKRTFFQNSGLYNQCSEIIVDYLNQGIIEQVRGYNIIINNPIYNLPHHAVCKENKHTSKVRIVFYAVFTLETNCP